MKMNKTVSVIIPAYNVGEYIGKCLRSVLAQTYGDLEIIVINDGSADNTLAEIKSYSGDARVKLIDQENAGVAAARNTGIAAASGKYLAFVDSDDWIEPLMYEKLRAALINEGADMAACNYNVVYDNHTDFQYGKARSGATNVYDDVYAYFCGYCACQRPNNYIWTRLYKTETVKRSGVLFENYKLGDDTLFNFKLLPHIQRVAWLPDGLYNYYQRQSSNVYTVAKKYNLAEVYADTFDSVADYYRDNGFAEFLSVLPVHAFSRLRSIFFYSRLAGIADADIEASIALAFKGRKIYDYLTGRLQ